MKKIIYFIICSLIFTSDAYSADRALNRKAMKAHLMSHARVGQRHQLKNPGHKVVRKKRD